MTSTLSGRLHTVTGQLVARYGVPATPPPVSPPSTTPPSTLVYDSVQFAADGSGIGGALGRPIAWDAAPRYQNDAALRAAIRNYGQQPGDTLYAGFDPSKAGTCTDTSKALYIDGLHPDLVEWLPTGGPDGGPVLRSTIKGLNTATSAPTGELGVRPPSSTHSVWLWVRRRYQPGFNTIGDADSPEAIAYNTTPGAGGFGAGFKCAPYVAYGYFDTKQNVTYYGRAGLQCGNGGPNGRADYSLVNLPQGSPQPVGISDTNIAHTTTEWLDGTFYDTLVKIGNRVDPDGMIRLFAAAWLRRWGQAQYQPMAPELTGLWGPSTQFDRPVFGEIMPFSLNHNRARKTDQHFDVWGWAAFNLETDANPFNVQ